MDPWISPHYRASNFPGELSDFDRIDLFEDSIRGWHLDPAARLAATDSQAGFAVLSIVMAYFETMAKYRGDSGDQTFAAGFTRALGSYFPDSESLQTAIDVLWKRVRNGLYHHTAVGDGIGLHPSNPADLPMWFADETLVINVGGLVRALQEDVSKYIRELRDPANHDLRAKFIARFDARPK